ncbi:MAG: LacI family DNA-binding transcriptional regulator [Lachnospiraceae bacterium]|nr:LacI family DNA-binding transcriptional regulator [Lachnospiraceae bacterium]
MSATIKDIAKMVGVSPSTVSRVINGTAPISDEVSAKIQKAMEELDYHPNARARSFATGMTNTVGLVVDASNEAIFSNSFFNRSVYAIEKVAQQNSYNLIITNGNLKKFSQFTEQNNKKTSQLAEQNNEKSSPVVELIYEKKVDGLIVPPSSLDDGLFYILKKEKFPFVCLGQPDRDDTEISWVDIDNSQGARQGVEHLREEGFERIVLVIDEDDNIFSRKRVEGYQEAIRDYCEPCVIKAHYDYEQLPALIRAAIPFGQSGIGQTEVSQPGTSQAKTKAATKPGTSQVGTKPGTCRTAFLCSSNDLAFHTLKTLQKDGILIPDQAGIVTFDNYPIAEYMEPQLSAIDVDTCLLGQKAAELLLRILRGDASTEHELIPTALIARGSSLTR